MDKPNNILESIEISNIMSNNKSLGSSPIGLKSNNSSMGFIPDLGVADSQKNTTTASVSPVKEKQPDKKKGKKKKVVSYNLEVELIDKIKSIANKKEMYYSSFVSMVLKSWLAGNNQP